MNSQILRNVGDASSLNTHRLLKMRRPWNQVDYSRCVVLEHQDASSLNTLRLRKMRRPWTLFRSKLLKDKTRERKPEKNGLIFFMLNYTTIKDVLNLEDASTISISILLFFWREGVFSHILSISHLSCSSHQYTCTVSPWYGWSVIGERSILFQSKSIQFQWLWRRNRIY